MAGTFELKSTAAGKYLFNLKAGIHRLQAIRPKDGDSFIGEAGAIRHARAAARSEACSMACTARPTHCHRVSSVRSSGSSPAPASVIATARST